MRALAGAAAEPAIAPGTIIGKYTVAETSGDGPLGPQFLGADGAAKVLLGLLPDLVRHAGDDSVRSFLEEAKAAARVRDANVVRLLKVGPHAGGLYFATEFAEGCTAAELVAADGPLAPAAATRIVRDIAAGLATVHRFGLVHRDVRPENVLVCQGGPARLAGLGLVRAAETLQEFRLGIPMAGPMYAAPEFFRDGRADVRCDLYSLGGTYFFLLTGRTPFVADTSLQVLHKHSTEPAPDPRTLAPDIPPGCAALVAALLEKGPSRRPQTAAAVIEALDRLLAELPAPPPIRLPRPAPAVPSGDGRSSVRRPVRKSSAGWVAAGLSMALAAVAATAIVLLNRTPAASPAPAEQLHGRIMDAPVVETKPAPPDPIDPSPKADPEVPAPPAIDFLAAEFETLSREAYGAAGDQAGLTKALAKLSEFARRHADARDPRERDFAANALAVANHLTRVPETPKAEPKPEPVPDGPAAIELPPRWSVKAGVQHPMGLLVSPDGKTVVTRSADLARIDLWDAATGKALAPIRAEGGGHFNYLQCFTEGGKVLLVGSQTVVHEGNQARMRQRATAWSVPDGRRLADQAAHAGGMRSMAASPDGTLAATLGGDADQIGELKLWDASLTAERATIQGHVNGVHLARFSPDGRRLVTVGRPRNAGFNDVRLWDADGKECGVLLKQVAHVVSVEFSADGKTLLVLASDGVAHVLDPADSRHTQFALGNGGFYQTRFHPGRGLLAVPALRTDKTVRFEPEVWDVAAGRKIASLAPGGQNLQSLLFSPDGARLGAMFLEQRPAPAGAAPAIQYSIRVWEIASGKTWTAGLPSKMYLPGDALAFSPDGRAMVLRGGDGVLRLWDAGDGRALVALRAHASLITAMAYSPDGATLYTAGQDGLAKAWDFAALAAPKPAPAPAGIRAVGISP